MLTLSQTSGMGYWGVPLAIFAGAIRNSTPFLFVSLGETLTERSGRINLGQEGTLVMGAMVGFGVSYLTAEHFPSVGRRWPHGLASSARGLAAAVLGLLHAWLCSQPRVNDIAVGIGIMIFGAGLAFYLGKPFIEPTAPQLPAINLGWWSHFPADSGGLEDQLALSHRGCTGADDVLVAQKHEVGIDRPDLRREYRCRPCNGLFRQRRPPLCNNRRGFLAGVGGSFLSLYSPGSWNEGLSSGQGLMAVALVIFARWNPINCLYASLLFGGAKALGPSLQSVGLSKGRYIFDAAPYFMTLLIMILTCSASRSLIGAPGELGKSQA